MHFKYIAQNKDGRRIVEMTQAEHLSIVVSRLKEEGLLPLKVFPVKNIEAGGQYFFLRRRVTGNELAIFTRQLASTLKSGLLLTEALETIVEDMENKYFQEIILAIIKDIRGGSDFSAALSRHPKIFSMTYSAIIKSGEATGRLDQITKDLAQYLENSEKIKEKVITSLRYPLFVLGFAVFVVAMIVLFLIPKFKTMFETAGGRLPLLTRMVVGVSEFSIHNFFFVLLAMVVLWIWLIVLLRNPKFRYAFDAMIFRLPIIGKEIIHKASISNFCRTLSVLLNGGVGLSKSLEISAQVANHSQFSDVIEKVRERVVSGSVMSKEMSVQKIFPGMVRKMVAVGEKTGKLAEMLGRTADYYDNELEHSLTRLTSLIEPILIIFVGGIVLIVVLALYLPIFNITGALK